MNHKDQRLKHEVLHGKFLAEHSAGEIWNWESPAGKERWKRRVAMLSSHIKPGMNTLEVGCGTGYLTKELVKTGTQINAIDISPDLLKQAESEIKAPNVTFMIENAYDMSFKNESFDSIVGSSVLHHLDIDSALTEFYRVLKPGGNIYFTEPNMMNPQIALQKKIPYLKRRLGDSPDETAFFRWSLAKKLDLKGFIEINIVPFDFLHPSIPKTLIPVLRPFCTLAEKLHVLSEIAGSLYIRAKKPE
ncbi:MAG TPA: class I SAM-dependent methyltransferase [bacterium]|nr:class I SAM-dependent methyltransferase [bacterium]